MKNRIKILREEKGLSLKELSEALNIPYQSLRNYEISKREPKIEIWNELAEFFDVDTQYIMGLSNIRNESNINLTGIVNKEDIPEKVKEYFDDLMALEIRNGDQRYKLFYDPSEKGDFTQKLLTKEYPTNTIGIKYTVKEYTEDFLKEYYDLERYLPYSNENAVSYTRNKIKQLKRDINNYFLNENESRRLFNDVLKDEQINSDLSPELYSKIIEGLEEFDFLLYEMDK